MVDSAISLRPIPSISFSQRSKEVRLTNAVDLARALTNFVLCLLQDRSKDVKLGIFRRALKKTLRFFFLLSLTSDKWSDVIEVSIEEFSLVVMKIINSFLLGEYWDNSSKRSGIKSQTWWISSGVRGVVWGLGDLLSVCCLGTDIGAELGRVVVIKGEGGEERGWSWAVLVVVWCYG